MTGDEVLCGTGWGSWTDVLALLAGWDATWSDLDGAHVGAVPDEPPKGTHLWAWRGDAWARVRIDEDEAVVGVLHPEGHCPQNGECPGARVAAASETSAASWPEPHVRLPDTLRSTRWLVRTVHEGVTMTFVRQAEGVNRSS